MTYAIIGFGAVGQALATAFARKGLNVKVASRRPPEALAPQAQAEQQTLPLAAQKLALIDSLHSLLTSHSALHTAPQQISTPPLFTAVTRSWVEWHASVHGIRAGPARLFC